MTEDKIKEAFEAWWNKSGSSMITDMMEYGLATTIKDACFLAHQAGYLACLNGLEQQLKDAERYRFIKDEPWSANVSEVICHHQNAAWDNVIDAAMAQGEQ